MIREQTKRALSRPVFIEDRMANESELSSCFSSEEIIDWKFSSSGFVCSSISRKNTKWSIIDIWVSNNRFILLIANKILGIGKPLYIYIKDHQIYGILDIQKGIYNISKEKLSNKYIELSSGTLYEMLTNPWGVDTLIISGCFKCISYDIKDVVLSLNIANLNSAGFYLNFRTFIQIRNIKSLLKIYRTWSNWNNEIGISK